MFLVVSFYCALWISSHLECGAWWGCTFFKKKSVSCIWLFPPFSWRHRDLFWPWEHYHQHWNDWWGLVAWLWSRRTLRDVPCQLRGAHRIASQPYARGRTQAIRERKSSIQSDSSRWNCMAYKEWSAIALLPCCWSSIQSCLAKQNPSFAFFLFSVTGIHSWR